MIFGYELSRYRHSTSDPRSFAVQEVWYRTHDPRTSHLPKNPEPAQSPPPVEQPKVIPRKGERLDEAETVLAAT